MRAHFAGDIVVTASSPVEDDCDEDEPIEQAVVAAAAAEQPAPLNVRIVDFKRDAKNMAELTEFIDEVLQKAETEVVKQQNAKNEQSAQATTPKEKSRQSFAIPDFKNGKVVNRARGLVVRIFDAICNCANNAAAPAQRIKLRGKRGASTNSTKLPATESSAAAGGGDTGEKSLSETKEKSKKLENGKEKKGDRKKTEELQFSVAE